MRTKLALATLAVLLAPASSDAEDNRACILKATEALPRIRFAEPFEIARHRRPDIGIECGRACAFELAELTADLV